MTHDQKRTMGWVAVAVVVLALIAVFAMPNRTNTGDSLTTGTPPVTDTTPNSNMTPPTPAPAAPY